MKSEYRHELETNTLAQAVSDGGQAVRGYLLPIFGGVVVVSAIAISIGFYSYFQQQQLSEAWDSFYVALDSGSPEDMQEIAKHYSGSYVAPYAELQLGWYRFQEGKDQLINAREQGSEKLEQAVSIFKKLSTYRNSHPDVARQAAYGEGLAQESMGKVKEAITSYNLVTTEYPNSIEAIHAKDRAEVLAEPGAEKFYAELAAYKPPRVNTDLPSKATDDSPLAPLEKKSAVPVPPPVPSATESPVPAPPAAATKDAPKEEPKSTPAPEMKKDEPAPPAKTEAKAAESKTAADSKSAADSKADAKPAEKSTDAPPAKAETPAEPKSQEPKTE